MPYICIRSADSVTVLKIFSFIMAENLHLAILYGRRKCISKTFFRFFPISGPTGSGKPDASIQGESLGQEASNDTSSMRIGPAVPPTLPLITPILIRCKWVLPFFGRRTRSCKHVCLTFLGAWEWMSHPV